MNEIQHLDTVVDNWSSNNESILDIELLAQGWSDLHYGCDIRGGRLRSGGREFGNGFGTHADSHIRIRSRKALRRFRAFGGAAENAFTAAMAEQIPGMIFAVAADGVRVAQSDELRYGMISEFDVELGGATTIELFIQSPSGTHLAHANWCDVTFETVDGEQIICGRARSMNFPLSFHYGKLDSADFTARYGLDHTRREMDDHVLHEFTSGPAELRMTLRCKAYREFPVLEWHTTFENCSDRRSEPLSQIRTLNLTCEPQARPQLLRHRGSFHWDKELAGSGTAYSNAFRDSFRPVWWLPSAPEHIHFGGTGGRPSADWMPYFDLPDGETNWRAAVGWAGEWCADARWDGERFHISAGLADFDAYLEPGEKFEFPSILLQYTTSGARERAVNLWRRFVTAKIMLPVDGAPPRAPLSAATWGGMTEKQHLEKIALLRQEKLPVENYWIDAGWFAPESLNEFEPTWSNNVGDWEFDSTAYPEELRNVAAACHADGRSLLLWFEPERVRTDRKLAKEHPEYLIFDGSQNALLNLGDPAAWRHCFDTMSRIIEANRIDWFRQDFNISPLPYWRSRDEAGRRGVTEVRYVAGLYKLWRELRRKFPHLMIDNCASGGRRLDFELLRYSLPLWYSDMQCSPAFDPRYSLTHIAGMSDYWPRFAGGVQNPSGGDTYNFRASMANGMNLHYHYTREFSAGEYPHAWLRERLDEYLKIRDCLAGDFHVLNPPAMDDSSWAVMQYDLPEESRGVITVFRGQDCPEIERTVTPRGLVPEAEYAVSDCDGTFPPFTVTGAQWMRDGLALRLDQPRTALLISYSRVNKQIDGRN